MNYLMISAFRPRSRSHARAFHPRDASTNPSTEVRAPHRAGAAVDVPWSCADPWLVNKAFQQVSIRKRSGSAVGRGELLAVDKSPMCLGFGKQNQRGRLENIAGMCKQNNSLKEWVGLVRILSGAGEIRLHSWASEENFIRPRDIGQN